MGLVRRMLLLDFGLFADHYERICTYNSYRAAARLKAKYERMRPGYLGEPLNHSFQFDAEPVECVIARMNRRKAARLDDVTAEHLQHCHSLLPCVLAKLFNPCPGNGFFATFAGKWGVIWPPRHISSSRAHSNKIPTAIPMFSGSSFSMVPLPLSCDVDIRQKFKMAVIEIKCADFTAV